MKNLYIFTLPYCKFCKSLTNELERLSISFIPIVVPDNPEICDNVKKQLGVYKLDSPMIFFQEKNNGEGYIYRPGVEFNTVEDAIEIIKNNIEV